MMAHGHDYDGTLHFICHNPECPQHDIPVKLPEVPVSRFDPRKSRAIVRQEMLEDDGSGRRKRDRYGL